MKLSWFERMVCDHFEGLVWSMFFIGIFVIGLAGFLVEIR